MTEPSDVRVTIPGYRDLVRVGSGGFSMVYSAYQEAFDRTVAVKVLTVELVDENAQRRFQRECRASGRLSNHPSIVTVLDSGFTDDGRPFITTEFMTQGSLADRLDDRGPYAVAAALEIGVLMCGALAAVHAAGILHRDIKPQNILVSDYGEPGLADFGISAITVGPEASIGTSSITPLHVAPEVLEGQPTSAASDVYSLGSTLYMLLAGRAPFQQGNDDALLPLMRRVVMDPIPDIDRPDIPPEVMDLLRYSMAKQPFARYSTAVSFGEAIQATQKYLGYPVTALRKPGTGTGDYVLPPAPDGAAITDLAIPPSAAIVGDAGLVGSGSTENAAGAIGAIGAAGAVLPPGSVETSGPAPVVAPKGGSKKGLLVAVGAVVVVMLVAAALFAKSSSNANPKVAAGQDRARSGAANNRLTDPANSTESTDPNSTTESTTAGQPLDPAPGLRFDMDAITVEPLTPTPGGTLRTAIDSEPGSWNPATSRLYDGNQLVATAIFDPLAVLTATGPEPYLATKITPNDAFDHWTIELPAGVTFHDGSPLNAAAVKANFDARLANDLLSRPLAPVEAARVDGDNVVVSLRQPWPAFPVALSGQSGLMAAPSYLSATGDDHPIGTGPYSFVKSEQGKSVSVKKNASYRIKGRPYLEGIEFSVIGSGDARAAALKGGQVDVAYLGDPMQIDELANDWSLVFAKSATVASVIFNVSTGPTSDARVRQALSAAVDRDALNETLWKGKAQTASSPFPSQSPWANSDTKPQLFDLDRARTLLADYQKPDSSPLEIRLLIGTSARQREVADAIAAQWAVIGVTTKVTASEDAVSPIVDGTYQAALWNYDVPTDPDEMYHWFHTDATPGQFTYDLTRLHDPNVDRGFETGRKASSAADRHKAYGNVEQGLTAQVPAIWFAYLPAVMASSPRVVGWDPRLVGGVKRGGIPWATAIGFK